MAAGPGDLHAVRKQLVALMEPKQLPTPLERRNERGGRIVRRRGGAELPGWSRTPGKSSMLPRSPSESLILRPPSNAAIASGRWCSSS